MIRRAFTSLSCLGLCLTAVPALAAPQTWVAGDGVVTIALDPDHLAQLGLEVAGARTTREAADLLLEGSKYSFRAGATDLEFRTDNGGFVAFTGGDVRIPIEGGLAFQSWHPRSRLPLAPAFLFDFALEIDARGEQVRLVGSDPSVRSPLEVRSTSFRFTWNTGELALSGGDLVITAEWARSLGQPYLEGLVIGSFELAIDARPESGAPLAPTLTREEALLGPGGSPYLDVTLGQLYGLQSFGRNGVAYPNGVSGLAAATTSCNSGEVRVPWNAPMQETHPTIGIALFRLNADGVLEMIGKNWMKHGFAALSNDQCNLGCEGCGGNELCIGCSDTYSASLNANRFYLGPRHEIDPYTGGWVACGSFFDEPVVPDGDCARDYFGAAPDGAAHRLEVWDEDLGNPGASYFYEGLYVVADDVEPFNSIGWRECTTSWTGSSWAFTTLGGGLTPEYGPYVFQWGDEQLKEDLAADDGKVVLATQVTDLGGGQWHYEYAVYNWFSWRGVNSISIPVAGVNVTNVGYHDIDKDPGNDWSVTNDGTTLTWATDDYVTDPDANAIFYQTMFNFRFDADQPPTSDAITLGIFKPGVGTSVSIVAQMPTNGGTDVAAAGTGASFELLGAEPNPFTGSTTVRFSVERSRDVRLTVVDVTGRLVQVLTSGPVPEGSSAVRWNGRDTAGEPVAPGVYFFRLESGRDVRTVKGTFLR